MFQSLISMFRRGAKQGPPSAQADLPPIVDPKVKKNGLSLPSFLKTAKPDKTSAIQQNDRRLINTDLTSLRNGANTRAIVRDFVAASPDLSSAVWAYIRNAVTKDFTALAKNLDGTCNPEATAVLQELITRFNVLTNYEDGYASMTSISSLAESWVKELMQYGAASGELVLNKAMIPSRIQPVSVVNIKFYPDSNGVLRPKQEIGDAKIDLDTPAFVYASLDQDLLDAYSSSPLEAALQPALFSTEFVGDVRKVIQRVLHPRMYISVDDEKLRNYLSPEAQHDPVKRQNETNAMVQTIQDSINNLNPEDALVMLKSVEVDLLNNGNTSLSDEYKIIKEISDAKLATGAKTMPAILGHGSASSNVASTETMLFVKSVIGVQAKLNEMFSRLFTLAVRLLGNDVYVEFRFGDVDLRPEGELEAFRAVKQSRVLELLSLGLITDEEASIQLTGKLPPAGFKPLSGTMFKTAGAASSPTGGANSDNTPSNSGSTLNQNLNSDAPKGVKSQNTKKDPQKAEVLPLRSN